MAEAFGIPSIVSVIVIGMAYQMPTNMGIIRGGGNARFPLILDLVSIWGIVLPVSALAAFVFHWPVLLVYACTCLDEIGKLPWVFAHFAKYKWVRDLTRDPASVNE